MKTVPNGKSMTLTIGMAVVIIGFQTTQYWSYQLYSAAFRAIGQEATKAVVTAAAAIDENIPRIMVLQTFMLLLLLLVARGRR